MLEGLLCLWYGKFVWVISNIINIILLHFQHFWGIIKSDGVRFRSNEVNRWGIKTDHLLFILWLKICIYEHKIHVILPLPTQILCLFHSILKIKNVIKSFTSFSPNKLYMFVDQIKNKLYSRMKSVHGNPIYMYLILSHHHFYL